MARLAICSVAAPEVPAEPEVENGSERRQHSRTEALFFATIAVASRKVPLVVARGPNASAEAAEAKRASATGHILFWWDGWWVSGGGWWRM